MKKTVSLFLSALLMQTAYPQSVFPNKENALKYIKDAFEYAFDKGPLTATDSKVYGKFVFRYEINGEKLLVVKNTIEYKQGESFYPYIWIEMPLDELVVLNNKNNIFKNTTNISLSGSNGEISTGYSEKGIHQAKFWYRNDEFYVPFKYASIKDGLANLTAAFRFLNDNKKKLSENSNLDLLKTKDVNTPSNNINSKKSEVKKEYYSTGELESETAMLGDKLEGVKKYYYRSGKLKSFETYKNGIKDGPYEYYFENGQLRQSCNYTNGKFNGNLKEYYSNGVLKNESQNIAGAYQGYVKTYSETGKLLSNKYYVKGKISGTMTVCDGANYFLGLLKNDKDDQLGDKQAMRLDGRNIQGFYYEYFSKGAAVLNRASHCRLDYIDEPTTEKGWVDIYNSTRNAFLQCKDLQSEKEYYEKSDLGLLRQQTFTYDKTYFIKVELILNGLKENLSIYVSRIEKK